MNGSAVISCLHGQWNGTKPSCNDEIEFTCTGTPDTGTPWYVYVAASAGGVVVIAAAVTVVSCFILRDRRKKHQRNYEPEALQVKANAKQVYA